MKTKIIASLILLVVLSSCSSETETNSGEDGNYFPLSTGNYWTYDVEGETNGRDSLYVANDTLINNSTYKKMKTQLLSSGFFSNALQENALRTNGSSVELTGGLGFDLGLDLPIDLAVSNFKILDNEAVATDVLTTTTGTFSQTLETFPLAFEYTLKSVADGSLETFTSPSGTIYSDIIKTKIVLSLKISTTTVIPGTTIPVTVNILDTQDVVKSTQFYSKNIGMVYSNTQITYELNPLLASELPIPASGNQTQEEFLDTYEVE